MPSDPPILVDRDDGIVRVTLNNPAKRNAMSYAMWTALADVLESVTVDPQTRVIVVTGAGDRAFCAGNDISEFKEWRDDEAKRAAYDEQYKRAYRLLRDTEHPTLARVRGVCVGGGFEIAQLCDLQIASDTARFGVTPARLGLGYKLDDVALLVERCGARATKELLFTARLFAAHEAMSMGLVNRVVADADLDACVTAYAEEIASNAPLTLTACKRIVAEAIRPPADRDAELCDGLVRRCYESEDYLEGQRAFAEKRKPVFRGR